MANAGVISVTLRGDLAGFEKAMDRGEARLERMAGRMTTIGTRLSLGLTVALAAIGGVAVKASVDFEQAMAGVAKTVDATDAQIAGFGEEFTRLSEVIPVARTELAGIAEEAGQLGVALGRIPGFTRTVADLRVATDLGEEAGNSLARLANIMGMRTNPEFARMGATIVALGNDGASTEREIAAMSLRIAGAGKIVGLSAAQVLGFAGALSSVGIEAEAGGTAISRVFADVASAVASGGPKLESFASIAGMSGEAFRAAFEEDAARAVVTFIEGIGRLEAAGHNVFAVLEGVEFQNVRIRDALLRAAGAGNLLRDQLALGSRAWQENTALTKEAERFYATAGGQLKTLRNRVANLAGEFGDTLVPVLLSTVDALEPLLDVTRVMIRLFSQMPEPVQAIAIASGAFLAVLGPLTFALGTTLSGVSGIAAIAGKAAGGINILLASMKASAVLGFSGSIAALKVQMLSLGALVTPGSLLLVGLGLLAALFIRNKLAAMEMADAMDLGDQKLLGSFASLDQSETLNKLGAARHALAAAQERENAAAAEALRQRNAWTRTHGGTMGFDVAEDTASSLALAKRDVALFTEAIEQLEQQYIALAKAAQPAKTKDEPLLPDPGSTDAEDRAGRIAAAHDDLTASLRAAAGMETLLGAEFDLNAERVSAYTTALRTLLEEGVSPNDARVRAYTAALAESATAVAAADAQERTAAATKRRLSELQSQAMSIYAASITPLQQYQAQVRVLNEALAAGVITTAAHAQATEYLSSELKQNTAEMAGVAREQGLFIGESLVRGIIGGSLNLGDLLKSVMINLALAYITGPLKLALGIASPSKVFRGFGENIGEGLALGIESVAPRVAAAAGRLVNAVQMPAVRPMMALAGPTAAGAAAVGSAALAIDASSLPRPLTPMEAARDNLWLELLTRSETELKARGRR